MGDKVVDLGNGIFAHLYPRAQLRRKRTCRSVLIPSFLKAMNPLPIPPATIDWTKNNTLKFPIDGNDKYGDCYYAAACHASQTFTGNVATEDSFNVQEIVKYYLRLSGGDNGLSTEAMMGEWKSGLCGGSHKILDDMAVNPNDSAAMSLGMWLFGGVLFTLGIPDSWLRAPQPGAVWDAGPGITADDNNGHAVLFNAYSKVTKKYKAQEWGFNPPVEITEAGVAVCDPEASIVFSMDWFNSNGIAPNGFSYEQLAGYWVAMGGNAVPPSPFTPPPTPVPVPIPTPTPTPLPPIPVPIPPTVITRTLSINESYQIHESTDGVITTTTPIVTVNVSTP